MKDLRKFGFISQRSLKGASSIILDSTRLMCSLLVLVTHSLAVWFPAFIEDKITSHLSHGAVIVFFVLSGYVIAHTTTNKSTSITVYLSSRLSRLYSFVFPALVLSAVCAIISFKINTGVYTMYDRGSHNVFRYLLSLFFGNELWFLSAAPLINGPLWSLGYEFWYYILWGLWVYRRKIRGSLVLLVITMLIVGPKILLMMFPWLLGVFVYHCRTALFSVTINRILCVFFLCIALLLSIILPPVPFAVSTVPWFWASQFVTDWIVGLFVSIGVWFLPTNVEPQLNAKHSVLIVFRKYANLTFPIYVFHFPLLVLCKALLLRGGFHWDYIYFWIISLVLVSLFCVVTGFELEKLRPKWKQFFTFLFGKLLSFSFIYRLRRIEHEKSK